jgi:hypothetical protein
MRNRPFLVVILLIVALISFWAGAITGAFQIAMANSAGIAMVQAVHLGMIERGEIEALKGFLNIELNTSIWGYGYFLDHDYSWILFPIPLLASKEDRNRYMQTAVKYRLENPYEIEWPKISTDEAEKNLIEYEKYYNLMLKHYSQDTHNKHGLEGTASRPPQP